MADPSHRVFNGFRSLPATPYNTPNDTPVTDSITPPKRIYLETLGCAKNRVDSEIMLTHLARHGHSLTADPEEAQVIIVNTCAFLTEATEESIGRLLELSDYKGSGACEKLVCAGCLSERYREELLTEVPEIDGLTGSSDFEHIPALVEALYAGQQAGQAEKIVRLHGRPHYTHHEALEGFADTPADGPSGAGRLQTTPTPYRYVKVGEGCSNMCSFCNIPFLRGYFSSRPMQGILREIGAGAAAGVREFNLISQDTASWGLERKDGTALATLLRGINDLQTPHPIWVRLFYVYPNAFDDEAIAAMAESPHIVPYLDMPFQHIADPVLKAMNRRITGGEIREKMAAMRAAMPGLTLRTTFITGFPNEGEAEFRELLDFVEEGHFDHVGVFPYSHEDNIKSAQLGDPVPNAEKRARRKALMEAQQAVAARRNAARVGTRLPVLVEGLSEETELLLQGRAPFQGPEVDGHVLINEGETRGEGFQTVEITEAHVYDLVGRIIND